jgi:hypothetical protein
MPKPSGPTQIDPRGRGIAKHVRKHAAQLAEAKAQADAAAAKAAEQPKADKPKESE